MNCFDNLKACSLLLSKFSCVICENGCVIHLDVRSKSITKSNFIPPYSKSPPQNPKSH